MKKKIKAIIVDDERLARKELKSMLSEYDNLVIAGEAENVNSAIELLADKPDVIFLDIQMPGESGFELFEKTEVTSKVIFITAYDEYALKAFEVNALDYLLKPINPERLRASIERLEHTAEVKHQERILTYEDKLFIAINNKPRFLKLDSVVCIKSAGDYSEIFTDDKKRGITSRSMNEWENRLPEQHFLRVHRGTIINMEHVIKIEEWISNSYRIFLKNLDEPVIMSRRFAAQIKARLT